MQKRILSLFLVSLILSACGASTPPVKIAPPPATDLGCDVGANKCSGDCPALREWTPAIDAVRGPVGDFDDLADLAIEDAAILKQCEAKLRACQACLERGRKAGLIR